jgi:hypothetical protein
LEIKMAKVNQAVAPAQSAIATIVVDDMFGTDEIESIEQLGREYQMHEDALAKANRSLGSCDVALFDIVKGMDYVRFMKVREHFVTGCRDKGCPTDDAAGQVWVRAIKRLTINMKFVRPTAQTKDAKRMSEKAAKQAEALAKLGDAEIESKRAALIERGDTAAMREALTLSKELDRRAKPEIDARAAGLKALRDKIVERVKDLAKAGTQDAEDKLVAALNALS